MARLQATANLSDPLVQCLSDVNSLLEKLNVVNGNEIEMNLVTTYDDLSTNSKLIAKELWSLPQNFVSRNGWSSLNYSLNCFTSRENFNV